MDELPRRSDGPVASAPLPAEGRAISRRNFLQQALLATGVAALPSPLPAQSVPPAPAPAPTGASLPAPEPPPVVYLSFSPDEAAFVEALVNVMCPADHLTPSGVDCGLALFIDRQLAGPYGKGERLYRRGPWRAAKPELGYQRPLTPEEFFKTGLAAADAACRKTHGTAFASLPAAAADRFLPTLATGETAEWFNDLVYPLFVQACFADPAYGGNRDKAFWKLIGYPGLPAVNGENITRYRGKPFPGAQTPKSMEDFS